MASCLARTGHLKVPEIGVRLCNLLNDSRVAMESDGDDGSELLVCTAIMKVVLTA